MANRAKKISELPTLGVVANNILVIVEDVNTPSGNATSQTSQVTLGTLLNANQNVTFANVVINNDVTPANSTATVAQGTIWWDLNFIYVAVANNVIKRAALASF